MNPTPERRPTPARTSSAERRAFPRTPLARPCKVRRAPGGHALPGQTINTSPGGLLIELHGARRLSPGESIEVLVAWDGAPVVASASAIEARVVRAIATTDDRQIVALRFAEAIPLAQVA